MLGVDAGELIRAHVRFHLVASLSLEVIFPASQGKLQTFWALGRVMAMPALFVFVLNAMPSSGDAYGNFV